MLSQPDQPHQPGDHGVTDVTARLPHIRIYVVLNQQAIYYHLLQQQLETSAPYMRLAFQVCQS